MDFEVRRGDLRTHRTVGTDTAPQIGDGQVLLHVDHAALTSNNITYGAFGDVMGYWNFFPATDEGWGRVPVWGFADVVASNVDGIVDGDRFYGYLPMSTHLVVEPTRVTPHGFSDGAAHRAPMSPVYNQYAKVTDRTSTHDEHVRAVLRPLFTTSFLIDDWLAEQQMFGATSVVIASASSKTALALAALLHEDLTVVLGVVLEGLASLDHAEVGVRKTGVLMLFKHRLERADVVHDAAAEASPTDARRVGVAFATNVDDVVFNCLRPKCPWLCSFTFGFVTADGIGGLKVVSRIEKAF